MRLNFLLVLISGFYKLPFYGFLHPVYHNDLQPTILVIVSNISKNNASILKQLKPIKTKFLKTVLSRNNIRQVYNVDNSGINPNSVLVNETSPNINGEPQLLVTSSNVGKDYYRIERTSLPISPDSPLVSNNLKPSLSDGNLKQIDVESIILNRHNIVRVRSEYSIRGNRSSLNQASHISTSEKSINPQLNREENLGLHNSVEIRLLNFNEARILNNYLSKTQKLIFGFLPPLRSHNFASSSSESQWSSVIAHSIYNRSSSGVSLSSGTSLSASLSD